MACRPYVTRFYDWPDYEWQVKLTTKEVILQKNVRLGKLLNKSLPKLKKAIIKQALKKEAEDQRWREHMMDVLLDRL